MDYKQIPEGSTEIQTGLWLHTVTQTIGTVDYTFRYLYSAEGYCFYDSAEEIYRENENNELNLVAADEVRSTERKYMRWTSVAMIKDINEYVSVPVDSTYEIVN